MWTKYFPHVESDGFSKYLVMGYRGRACKNSEGENGRKNSDSVQMGEEWIISLQGGQPNEKIFQWKESFQESWISLYQLDLASFFNFNQR